jgi:signal transduction histidine kinase
MSSEVAIQQLKGIRSTLHQEGVDIDQWLLELGLELDWSQTQYRLDWADFCRILDYVLSQRDKEWLSARGADSVYDAEAALFRHGLLIGFDKPSDVLPWLVAPLGPLASVTPFFSYSLDELVPERQYRLKSRLSDDLASSYAQSCFALGVFREFPVILYESPATVEFEVLERGTDFTITFAERKPEAAQLRRDDRARARPEYLAGIDQTYLAMVEGQRQVQEDERRIHALEQQARQREKLDSLGNLTSGVAHDFNNVLQVASGQLDLLAERSDVSAGLKLEFDNIHRTLARGTDLTERLLKYAREDDLETEAINVKELLTNVHSMASGILTKPQSLEVVMPDRDLKVISESSGLENALLNLLINARDALEPDGHVVLTGDFIEINADSGEYGNCPPGNYVKFSVQDDGRGIPIEIQNQIYDPYFSTKGDLGNGLGLSIVWGFVQQSGGQIFLHSEENLGTRFDLLLPAQH